MPLDPMRPIPPDNHDLHVIFPDRGARQRAGHSGLKVVKKIIQLHGGPSARKAQA
jgi:hypothetical protein